MTDDFEVYEDASKPRTFTLQEYAREAEARERVAVVAYLRALADDMDPLLENDPVLDEISARRHARAVSLRSAATNIEEGKHR